MNKVLMHGIVQPVLQRLGVILTAYVVSLGVADDVAAQIAVGVTATVGVLLDLVIRAVAGYVNKTE